MHPFEGSQATCATSLTAQPVDVPPSDPSKHTIYYNAKFDDMYAPVEGPNNPYETDGVARGLKNHKLGMVEDAHVNSFTFDEQYNTFHR